jgi:large subunit ribosomal protein L13
MKLKGMPMKTYMANVENVTQKWYLVNAEGKTLGRLASVLASNLRGKNKPEFTPHADAGDFFIVINADKIHVTGNKVKDKKYHRHTGYIGGLKTDTFGELLARKPERIIELAVKGMLPKGPLGRKLFRKLKVYAGTEHPHEAQQPEAIEV